MSTTKTVVIAGSAPAVLERFTAAIEGAGHRVLCVPNARDLLARLATRDEPVDLVLLDLHLLDADGVDIVRRVRRLDAGRLSVLIFSGSLASSGDVRDLAQLGVSGYVNEHALERQILPALAPHLFPDNFNRRSSARVVLAIPVAYRSGSAISTALTLNIGKGGLAIRTVSPLDAGTQVRLRFRLPGSDSDIEADARVAWSSRRTGMGIQFERAGPADQSAIDAFVDRHDPSPRRG